MKAHPIYFQYYQYKIEFLSIIIIIWFGLALNELCINNQIQTPVVNNYPDSKGVNKTKQKKAPHKNSNIGSDQRSIYPTVLSPTVTKKTKTIPAISIVTRVKTSAAPCNLNCSMHFWSTSFHAQQFHPSFLSSVSKTLCTKTFSNNGPNVNSLVTSSTFTAYSRVKKGHVQAVHSSSDHPCQSGSCGCISSV